MVYVHLECPYTRNTLRHVSSMKLVMEKKVVVLYQVGSFYEIYGLAGDASYERMLEISDQTGLNMVKKRNTRSVYDTYRQKTVYMMGCKPENVDKHAETLLCNGWTIPFYNQRAITKDNYVRELYKIVTPGTYIYANVQTSNNILMVAWVSKSKPIITTGESLACGIGVLNYITGDCYVHSYVRSKVFNSPLDYDELESFYSAYSPSEFTLITDNVTDRRVTDLVNWLGVPDDTMFRHISLQEGNNKVSKLVRQEYQKTVLLDCYAGSSAFVDTFVIENGLASSALCYLLDFVRSQNKDIYHKLKHPKLFKGSNYLRLANHSLSQLNIIDSKQHTGSLSSIMSFLTRNCLTDIGRRVMRANIINPILDANKLTSMYDIVEHIKGRQTKYDPVVREIRSIVDIERYRTTIINKQNVSCWEFQKVYELMRKVMIGVNVMRDVHAVLIKDKEIEEYLIQRMDYGELVSAYTKLSQFFSSVINPDLGGEYVTSFYPSQYFTLSINSGFGDVFAELHDSLLKIDAVRKHLNSLFEWSNRKKIDKSKEPIEFNETAHNHVFTLQITKARSEKFKGRYDTDALLALGPVELAYLNLFGKEVRFQTDPGIRFKPVTNSASKRTVSNSLIDAGTELITKLKNKYITVVTKSFEQVIEGVRAHKREFELVADHVANLDGVFTRARIAAKHNYCKPAIVHGDKSFLKANDLRHPLIEHIQTDEIYKPNSITLGDGNNDITLLYGVNAVGKSSFIKSVGIAIVMAQSGFFVPATSFQYKPYERLFTRILGNDNIFKGLSTFQVEMSELNSILHFADENSLVIGDELCSGTEMVSALSIFCSGVNHIHNRRCSAIFATHLHEVADISNITDLERVKIKHMSIRYNPATGALEYDRLLREGFGDRCYGLEVCKSMNMPQTFLDEAWAIRAEIQPEFRSMFMRGTSKYNKNKVMTNCEQCGSADNVETHHMQPQKNADTNGFIGTFAKDHCANLQILCKKCHEQITRDGRVTHRVKQLQGGYALADSKEETNKVP